MGLQLKRAQFITDLFTPRKDSHGMPLTQNYIHAHCVCSFNYAMYLKAGTRRAIIRTVALHIYYSAIINFNLLTEGFQGHLQKKKVM